MLTFQSKNSTAVPVESFDRVQRANLESIKYKKQKIQGVEKLSTFFPEIRYKNVVRHNEDGTIDLIVDAGVANEIRTGFLPKRFYKAIRIKKEKGILGSKWDFKNIELIQVSEAEIVQIEKGFDQSLPIEEVENILAGIAKQKKGVKYFD